MRLTLECVFCGEPYQVKASNVETSRYCSRKCQGAAKVGVWHDVICACGCGTIMSMPDHRVQRGTRLFLNQSHCRAYLSAENHPNFRGGNHRYGPGWPKIAAAVRARDQVCQQCGKTPEANGRALAVHHIVPLRVSRDHSMENLIALCDGCHGKILPGEVVRYPEPYTKACAVCGNRFQTTRWANEVCSDACRKRRQNGWHAAYVRREAQAKSESYQRKRDRTRAWEKQNKEHVNQRQRDKRQTAAEHRLMVVARFVQDCCVIDATQRAVARDVFDAFQIWRRDHGYPTMSHKAFGTRLNELGIPSVRYRQPGHILMTSFYSGIALH
jgi:hypothetical protein